MEEVVAALRAYVDGVNGARRVHAYVRTERTDLGVGNNRLRERKGWPDKNRSESNLRAHARQSPPKNEAVTTSCPTSLPTAISTGTCSGACGMPVSWMLFTRARKTHVEESRLSRDKLMMTSWPSILPVNVNSLPRAAFRKLPPTIVIAKLSPILRYTSSVAGSILVGEATLNLAASAKLLRPTARLPTSRPAIGGTACVI